jgi:excisionase family DNA binding protein
VSDKLLTAEQVAVLLGTTPRHVRRLVFERRITYRKLGRYVRFHPRRRRGLRRTVLGPDWHRG